MQQRHEIDEYEHELDWGQAFFSGILAGAVLSALLLFSQLVGLTPLNLSLYIGSVITGNVSPGTWVLGFVVYLIAAGVIGLIYGAVFDSWGASGLERGLLLGIPHALLAGLFLWILPTLGQPPALPAPGFMGLSLSGVSAGVFLLVHLVFGGIMGSMYKVSRLYVPSAPELSNEPAQAWVSSITAIVAIAIVVLAAGYMYGA